MAAPVTFVFADFTALYPEFAALTPAQGQNFFNIATGYLRNDGTSPIPTLEMATTLLYLLTAHVAWMMAPRDAAGLIAATGEVRGLVGRISSASEGSVSVQTDYGTPSSPSQAWYEQTPYGAAYWQLIGAYRTMRYRPSPRAAWPIGRPWSNWPGSY